MTPLKTLLAAALAGTISLAATPSAQAYTIYFDDEQSGNILVPGLDDDGKPTKKAESFDLTKVRVWVFRKPEDYGAMLKAIKKSENMIEKWTEVGFQVLEMTVNTTISVGATVVGGVATVATSGTAAAVIPVLTSVAGTAGPAVVSVTSNLIQKSIDPAKLIARQVKHDIEDKYTINYGNLIPGGVISAKVHEKREKVHIVITAKGEKTVPLLAFSMMNTDSVGIAVNKDRTGRPVVTLLSHEYEPVFEGSYTKEEWKQLPGKTRDLIKKAEKDYVKAAKQAFKQAKKD